MVGSSDEEVDSILQSMGFSNKLIKRSKQKPRLNKILKNLTPEQRVENISVLHLQNNNRAKDSPLEILDKYQHPVEEIVVATSEKNHSAKSLSPEAVIENNSFAERSLPEITNYVEEEQSEIYLDEHSMSILENLVKENCLDEVLPTDFTSLQNVSLTSLIPPPTLFLTGDDQIKPIGNDILENKTFDSLGSTDISILVPISSPTTYKIVDDDQNFYEVTTTFVSAIVEPSLQPDHAIERVHNQNDNLMQSRPAVEDESPSLDLTGVLEYSDVEPRRGVKRNHEKNKRMTGNAYLGLKKRGDKWFQDIERSARELGPRCTSDYCLKGGHQCRNITERERKEVFDKFWSEMDWAAKKIYVVSMIDVHKPHRRAKESCGTDPRKSFSKKYHLNINNQRVRVCRILFLNTLGLKEWTVRYWLSPNKSNDESVEPTQELRQSHEDDGPSPPKRSRNNMSIKHQSVIRFLENMPKVPSHYCRKSTTKLYLEPIVHSLSNLYTLYVNFYKDQQQDIVSVRTFGRIFKQMNIDIFKPKKDMCDTCSKYKVGNLSKEIFDEHIKEKDEARKMKELDKDEAKEGKCYVFTVDLQSVKLAPFLRTSSMYYKTKLCVYNYTVYNLADNRARCYWFTEVDTDLTASTFASCLVDILSQYIDENPLPIIIYSDGCTYQNRNAIIANALLHLSKEKGVCIEQKYLVKGHTQMECDSVHSCIERQLKNKEIYLPSQYAQIATDARKNPFPYEQKILSFDFFKNYKLNMVYSSIKPSGAVVTDIKSIQYQDGKIRYKLTHDKNAIYQDLPLRPRTVTDDFVFPNLHCQRLTIKKSKYQHLQELKQFIPSDCHAFYDGLPKAD